MFNKGSWREHGRVLIIVFFNGWRIYEGESTRYTVLNTLEVMSINYWAKLFAINFSKNSNLDDSSISLPVFFSRTNVKLAQYFCNSHNGKVITNLDSWKVSGPNYIPVVVLKNYEPELLPYILAELFNMCLKGSCFPDCCKVSRLLEGLITDPCI